MLSGQTQVDGFPIVGIGASAGGLEALERFFRALPANTGAAFVVVQHLSPDFRSMMHELLGRCTALPVNRVTDGMVVEPDHVYLIPPGKEMIVSSGRLLLTDKPSGSELSLPVDVFFRSLAQESGPRGVAVVLSGTGSDGSRGVRYVHEAGGLVAVQDPETARFDGMPRMALASGLVDLTLPPEAMGTQIVAYGHRLENAQAMELPPSEPASGLDQVLKLLRDRHGLDFRSYKTSTVGRRIERRLMLRHVASLDAYAALLEDDTDELDLLYRDLLIGVTRFFRDPEYFQRLREEVIRPLVKDLPPREEVRAWVAGCGTGEEAYSVAMLLTAEMEALGRSAAVKVFATDIHQSSLDYAGQGVYPGSALEEVPAELRNRFFVAHGDGYLVNRSLRQSIVFAPHNVIRDAPFTRLDLITCRNLLIYLNPPAQKKVLSLFHFGLKSGGYLFLGASEHLGDLQEQFDAVDERSRLFRKSGESRLAGSLRSPLYRQPALSSGEPTPGQLLGAYDALLDRHMPPSLLINERRELIHAFGGASQYLSILDGRPTLDVLDLFPPALKVPLTGAIQRARKEAAPVTYGGVELMEDQRHRITVAPVVGRRTRGNFMLLTLELEQALPAAPPARPKASVVEAPDWNLDEASRSHIENLEDELASTRENLQTTIEELEASNEELQATNEELTASNEELQSTNEELQSVNEELFTVNAEYQEKIEQLTQLTEDMDNLLAATDVGTVFLDEALRVRRFTPRIAETFRLRPQDLGRRISDLSHDLVQQDLVTELEAVLRTGRTVEREVRDHKGNAFFLRMLPYRTESAQQSGVVLSLVGINALKEAEQALFRAEHLLDNLLENVPGPIFFTDAEGQLLRANRAFRRFLGVADDATVEGPPSPETAGDAFVTRFRADLAAVLEGETIVERLDEVAGPDGASLWLATSRLPIRDMDGKTVGMISMAHDVTAQHHSEAQSREAVRRRDTFIAMLSHELRNPLAAIVAARQLLAHQLEEDGRANRALELLRRQTEQMARLLDDLLDVSRLARNQIRLQTRQVDLAEVARQALQALDDAIRRREALVALALPDGAVWVDGDPVRLQQTLVNLLSNALRAIDVGGRIELTLGLEGDEAVVRVVDDGRGIEPQQLEPIFELFYQGQAPGTSTEPGMGVGLSLVRNLVDLHGGRIEAHSDGLGQGARFTVRLPLLLAPVRAVAAPAPAEPHGSDLRIVVVEDLEDSREALVELLQLHGCDVHPASNGQEALEVIRSHRPSVALVDVGLPDIDGYEVARRVRADPELAPIRLVALTGFGRESDRALALEAGFDDHVVKPVEVDRILQTLTPR